MASSSQWPFVQRAFFWTGLTLMIGFIMVIGKHLLIPFVIAVFVWYLINALAERIHRIKIRGWQVPRWLGITIAIIFLLFFVENIVNILVTNVLALSKQAPLIGQKIMQEIHNLLDTLDLENTPTIDELQAYLNLGTNFLKGLARSMSDTAGKTLTIFLYVAFLLAEQGTFNRKLSALFKDKDMRATAIKTLEVIGERVRSYLLVKTIASLTSAVLSYFVLIAVGVNLPELWALLVFLLNFIPYVGSIISMTLPALVALVQFDSPLQALIIAGGLAAASVLVANLLEPRMMGQSLNLSPLVIIVSLALWGTIWGVGGMIIAIPITVIIMIICAQFPETRSVAIILSQKGQVEVVTASGTKKIKGPKEEK